MPQFRIWGEYENSSARYERIIDAASGEQAMRLAAAEGVQVIGIYDIHARSHHNLLRGCAWLLAILGVIATAMTISLLLFPDYIAMHFFAVAVTAILAVGLFTCAMACDWMRNIAPVRPRSARRANEGDDHARSA